MGPESGDSLRPKHASPETAPPEQTPVVERRRVRVRVRKRHRWYRRKVIRRRVLLALGVLAVLLLADGGWAAAGAAGGLEEARTQLQEGAGALLEGDHDQARKAFQKARRGAEGAV